MRRLVVRRADFVDPVEHRLLEFGQLALEFLDAHGELADHPIEVGDDLVLKREAHFEVDDPLLHAASVLNPCDGVIAFRPA